MSNINITSPTSGETNSQWVDAITEATQRLSKNELAPHLHHHLFNLIDDCLDLGRDDILEQARNLASSLNLDDLLNDSIGCAMETTLVKLNSGQIVESMLFAIPMVMMRPCDQVIPERIPHPDRLCQLFRTHALIKENYEFVIHDELFFVEDMHGAPSHFRSINRILTQEAQSGYKPAETLKASKRGESDFMEGIIVLRFLVGVVIFLWQEIPFIPDANELEGYQARLGRWRSEFKQEMATQAGLVVWDLEPPSSFTTDELGNRLMQCVSYFYEMVSDLEHKNTQSAMVSLHGDHGRATEIGIEFFDRNLALIDRHVWPFQVINEIDLALENIISLLSRYPIKRVFPKALFPLVHSKTPSDCKLTVIR
jgi:hypothetical protein